MKKFMRSIFAFIFAFVFIPCAYASGEFKVGEEVYDSLTSAVKAVKSGGTVTLVGDYDNGDSTVQYLLGSAKTITLDLNGHELSGKASYGIIYQAGGTLTITDTSKEKTGKITNKYTNGDGVEINDNATVIMEGGTISAPMYAVYLYQGSDSESNTFILNGGNVEGYYYGIAMFDNDKLTINGGEVSAHGMVIANNGSQIKETSMTINGGKVTQLDYDTVAIYHPGIGTLTLNGGTITGGSGIEMRAGKLVVPSDSKVEVTATYAGIKSEANANGPSIKKGAAIAISQHVTKNPININIKGGKFNGYVPLYEGNPENNDAADLAKINILVSGGEFNSINGGTNVVSSADFESFIIGGRYNLSLDTKYILLPYIKLFKDDNYYHVVLKTEEDNETIDSDDQSDEVLIGLTEEQNKNLEEVINEEIKNDEELFEAVKGQEIEVILEVEENDNVQNKEKFEEKVDKGFTTLGYFDIDINVYEKGTENLLSKITETENKIKLSVVVPNDLPPVKKEYVRTYYIVREHNGEYELLEGKLSDDGKLFEFESDKFSTFLLAYNDVKNPQTGDNLVLYLVFGILAFVGMATLSKKSKRKNA